MEDSDLRIENGSYLSSGKSLLERGFKILPSYDFVSGLNLAYFSEKPELRAFQKAMDESSLWIYCVNFWLPYKDKFSGVYSVLDKDSEGLSMEFNSEEFEEKLKGAEVYSGVRINLDSGISFAPRRTIFFDEQDKFVFAKNGLIISIFSPKGAENLVSLGENNFSSNWVKGFKKNNQLEKSVSCLGDFFSLEGWEISTDCVNLEREKFALGYKNF